MQRTEQTQEIPETILEQLKASKYAGFPFFAYTGIKAYNLEGNDTLYLKSIPTNPNEITGIQIVYEPGLDCYKLAVFQKNQRTIPKREYPEIYVDQLAEIIIVEMGVQ